MEEKVYEILDEVCEEDLREEPDTDLFEEGYLDSLGLAQLVVLVEEELGIKLSLTELSADDVRTPAKLVSFLSNQK